VVSRVQGHGRPGLRAHKNRMKTNEVLQRPAPHAPAAPAADPGGFGKPCTKISGWKVRYGGHHVSAGQPLHCSTTACSQPDDPCMLLWHLQRQGQLLAGAPAWGRSALQCKLQAAQQGYPVLAHASQVPPVQPQGRVSAGLSWQAAW